MENLYKAWYFTFCGNHKYPNGYVKIFANDFGEARQKMFDMYEDKWGFQYTEEEFEGQVEQFGLYEVK